MSYDLGYEFGYESDWEKVPVEAKKSVGSAASTMDYRMSPPGGPGGAGSSDFVRRYLEMYGLPVPGDPAAAPPVGGTEGTEPPPPGTGGADAHDGLAGLGAVPPAPGDAPSAAPEGTPTLTRAQLQDAHRGTEWEGVRTELRDYYGFNDAEIDAFENQYRNASPADLRSGEPPILPAHPDSTTPLGDLPHADRVARNETAQAIRRRVADDMVHETGGRIHGMFAEGEISRDTADAMAAQMYRRAGVDPEASIPRIDSMRAAMTRSGSEPSPLDREMNSLRGSHYQPPDSRHPERGLHRGDPQVAPLISETEGHYSTKATESLTPLFGNVPGRGGYYGNTPNGRTHRTADAQAYIAHRGIERNAGELRRVSRMTAPPSAPGTAASARPPHPLQSEVTTFVSTYRETGTNRLTSMGSALDQRRAVDRPVDTSGLNAADRSGLTRGRAERRDAEEVQIRAEGREEGRVIAREDREEGRVIAREDREEGRTIEREGRELHRTLVTAEANHELQMKQQHDQQLNQLMQNMANHGMQIMQSQIQHLNNLTTEQLRAINQTTTQLLQQGSPRPFDIVAQMLSGGAPRR